MTIAFHQLSRFPEAVSVVDQVRRPADGGGARQPLIARDDLVACLDRMTARKVTIISAPAGSGKTSLLRAWAERADPDLKLVIVPVRRDQHDAPPFWLELLNAVRQVFGTFREGQPAATPHFNGRAPRTRHAPGWPPAATSGSACTSCAWRRTSLRSARRTSGSPSQRSVSCS